MSYCQDSGSCYITVKNSDTFLKAGNSFDWIQVVNSSPLAAVCTDSQFFLPPALSWAFFFSLPHAYVVQVSAKVLVRIYNTESGAPPLWISFFPHFPKDVIVLKLLCSSSQKDCDLSVLATSEAP